MSSILVLDDQATQRELFSIVLGHAGHTMLEASTGEQALALARAERPALIISDLMMPGMNGYEFVRELRADPDVAGTRVAFCTATYERDDVRKIARSCGVSHTLIKPCEPQEIIRVVNEILGCEDGPAPVLTDDFDRDQLRLLNAKLYQKVTELETANRERRRLLGYVVDAQETERKRIAYDIHDDSLQVMGAVALRVGLLASRLEKSEDREAAADLVSAVQAAVGRLRRLTFELRPRSLDTEPLAGALEDYLRETAPAAGLQWQLINDGIGELPNDIKTILFRIAQEAVHNVGKHAGARQVEISLLERDGGVELRVADDGAGFEATEETIYRPDHLGLASMRERAESAGGRIELDSEPAAGTTLMVWVPTVIRRAPARKQPEKRRGRRGSGADALQLRGGAA